eukprot:SAG22_NODE_11545_length_479_cov_1.881579_1_plen_79_part_00
MWCLVQVVPRATECSRRLVQVVPVAESPTRSDRCAAASLLLCAQELRELSEAREREALSALENANERVAACTEKTTGE